MAEYKTSVQTNYGFPLSFDATNKAPIIAKRIWNTYADALEWVNDDKQFAIVGLQLTVINDPDPKKNGVYFVSKIGEGAVDENGNKTGGEIIKVGSGEGSMAIPNFTIKEGTEDKVEEATSDNIGQIIYITTGTDSFPAGPYIVTGSGTVAKLGTTTASGDLAGDVTALKGRMGEAESDIEALETALGNGTSDGLIKDVNALKTKTANLVVNDVKDNGVSLANADGIVDLSNYTLNSELQTEVNKLNTAISEIKVPEYTIEEAAAGTGVAKAYQLKKDGAAIGATINIPVDMVVTGAEMVDTNDKGVEGKFIKLTIANAAKSELYIDVTELLNNYSAGDYITVSSAGTISVDITTLEAYLNTKYDATGAAAAVQSDLDAHKTANEETFKEYTKTTDLDAYIGTTLGYEKSTAVDTKISTALNDYIKTDDVDTKVSELGYAKKTEVASSISTALESYTKTTDLDAYIGTTLGYAKTTAVSSAISTALEDYIKTADVEAKVATFGYAKAADVESTYVKQADLNALTTDDIDDIINGDTVTE